jgi:membrane protein implicated in regulation of membrane protease activity
MDEDSIDVAFLGIFIAFTALIFIYFLVILGSFYFIHLFSNSVLLAICAFFFLCVVSIMFIKKMVCDFERTEKKFIKPIAHNI